MAQCPQCGASAKPDQAICTVCGSDLGTGLLQAAVRPPDTRTPRSSPPGAPDPAPRPSARPSAPSASRTVPDAGGDRSLGQPALGATIPVLVALAVTALAQQLLNSVVPPEAYVYRLFRPAGGWIMAVVPGLIAFVFIWTVVDLVMKYRLARRNDRDLHRPEINQLPMLLSREDTSVTIQRLRGWDKRVLARPVGRRIAWLLHHLDTTDAQSTHELVRHQADLDADLASSSFRTVRLFIWAMPILGFIGTVLGISLSVGGFSDFLTTNVSIDEIDAVTAELGEVASGLSFAFDTTLLGLLAGLVASVASSGVQARDERLLTGLEELGLLIMAGARRAAPADRPTPAAPGTPDARPGEAFDLMMRSRLEELTAQMDEFTQAVQSGMDGFLGEWSKLPPEVERVATDLNALRGHLSEAAKSTDRLVLETRVLLEGLKEASTRWGTGLEATLGSVNRTVEGLGADLQGVSDSLTESVSALSRRMTSEESVQRLSSSIADLGDRLEEVRETQEALRPLLSQLAGPMELRLTPTRPDSSKDGR